MGHASFAMALAASVLLASSAGAAVTAWTALGPEGGSTWTDISNSIETGTVNWRRESTGGPYGRYPSLLRAKT